MEEAGGVASTSSSAKKTKGIGRNVKPVRSLSLASNTISICSAKSIATWRIPKATSRADESYVLPASQDTSDNASNEKAHLVNVLCAPLELEFDCCALTLDGAVVAVRCGQVGQTSDRCEVLLLCDVNTGEKLILVALGERHLPTFAETCAKSRSFKSLLTAQDIARPRGDCTTAAEDNSDSILVVTGTQSLERLRFFRGYRRVRERRVFDELSPGCGEIVGVCVIDGYRRVVGLTSAGVALWDATSGRRLLFRSLLVLDTTRLPPLTVLRCAEDGDELAIATVDSDNAALRLFWIGAGSTTDFVTASLAPLVGPEPVLDMMSCGDSSVLLIGPQRLTLVPVHMTGECTDVPVEGGPDAVDLSPDILAYSTLRPALDGTRAAAVCLVPLRNGTLRRRVDKEGAETLL